MSLRVRIRPDAATLALLEETRRRYTDSYNRVAAAGCGKRVNGVELHKATYYSEVARSGLSSQLVISARTRATESLKSLQGRQKKIDLRARPEGRPPKVLRCPHSRGIGVRYDARSHRVSLAEGWAELCTLSGAKRLRVRFRLTDRYQRYVEAKVCTTELLRDRQGRWFLVVVVSVETQRPAPSGVAVGVDVGVSRPAVTSRNRFLGTRQWRDVDRRYQRQRRLLQMKGTRSARRRLKALSGRQGRFHRDCDHVLSKQLVLGARPGDTLVLEDLTDIRERMRVGSAEQGRRLHGWSFAQLRQFAHYKALLHGRHVEFVDPAYTSQRCSACAHTDRANRVSQSQFRCKSCGFHLNADLNASRNLEAMYVAAVATGDPVGPPSTGPSFRASPSGPGVPV